MCQLECERHVSHANEEEDLLAWYAWPIYSKAPCYSDIYQRHAVAFSSFTVNDSL